MNYSDMDFKRIRLMIKLMDKSAVSYFLDESNLEKNALFQEAKRYFRESSNLPLLRGEIWTKDSLLRLSVSVDEGSDIKLWISFDKEEKWWNTDFHRIDTLQKYLISFQEFHPKDTNVQHIHKEWVKHVKNLGYLRHAEI